MWGPDAWYPLFFAGRGYRVGCEACQPERDGKEESLLIKETSVARDAG